jgi:tripartite-type tricarboxylate transporter receptor subunit TctC
MFAPKGTPPAVVAALAEAMKAVVSEPTLAARLRDTQEMTLVLGGPNQLEPFFNTQVQVWGKVVRENNIKAQ